MSSFRCHRLPVLTSIGFALFASLVGAPVQARTPYDGLWSVSLKVGQGSCSEREIEVFIRNGEISHAGDRGFFTAEGRVGERGRIEVSIGAFGMWASADGTSRIKPLSSPPGYRPRYGGGVGAAEEGAISGCGTPVGGGRRTGGADETGACSGPMRTRHTPRPCVAMYMRRVPPSSWSKCT
jgi:hypothetical protein